MAGETQAAASAASIETRLEGYIHAGGILNDALLGRQDPGYVRQVYAPKHSGAVNLIKVGSPAFSFSGARSARNFCPKRL